MADSPTPAVDGENTVYLIDTSAFVFRAYHALPPLTKRDGTPTGAVYGFTNMLLRLLQEFHAGHIVAACDSVDKPTFRSQLYPEYKANRPPAPEEIVVQFPLVERVLQAFKVPTVRCEGYEADDVIATLAMDAKQRGFAVVIVSSDKDLMQLVGPQVALLDTMKNKRIGAAEVEQKYGVRPAQLGDWLALVGDSSDNVPGVPGVGAKTATKLLQQHGDLSAILTAAARNPGTKLHQKLAAARDQAELSRQLVELVRDCPLDIDWAAWSRKAPDTAELVALLDELEFGRLKQRVAPEARAANAIDRSSYQTVLTVKQLADVVAQIAAAGQVAVDVETTSLKAAEADVVGISLCWGTGKACYLPVAHSYLGAPKQLSLGSVREKLGPLLADPSVKKVVQHGKYDWQVLRRADMALNGISCDVMLVSYLLDPGRNSHSLDALARDELQHTMIAYREVAGKSGRFEEVDLAAATAYSGEDADATWRLAERLMQRLNGDPPLAKLLSEVELPLSIVLAEMELHGCLIDKAQLEGLAQEVAAELAAIAAAVTKEAGWEVNLNSPQQLQELLFDQLGLKPTRKTKTGYSTDSETLAELSTQHPIVARIDRYRTLSKLHSGYLDQLPRLVNERTEADSYIVQSGGGGNGATEQLGPQPAKYSDSHGGGAKDPSGVRGPQTPRAALGRLFAD